jgi:hypothetical protein
MTCRSTRSSSSLGQRVSVLACTSLVRRTRPTSRGGIFWRCCSALQHQPLLHAPAPTSSAACPSSGSQRTCTCLHAQRTTPHYAANSSERLGDGQHTRTHGAPGMLAAQVPPVRMVRTTHLTRTPAWCCLSGPSGQGHEAQSTLTQKRCGLQDCCFPHLAQELLVVLVAGDQA